MKRGKNWKKVEETGRNKESVEEKNDNKGQNHNQFFVYLCDIFYVIGPLFLIKKKCENRFLGENMFFLVKKKNMFCGESIFFDENMFLVKTWFLVKT